MSARIATLRHRAKCLDARQRALDEANAAYTLMMNVAKQEFHLTTVEQRKILEKARRQATAERDAARMDAYRSYGMCLKEPITPNGDQ